MSVLILLAHPSPESFNAALARKARETLKTLGYEVLFHDLYAEGFDPLLRAEERDKSGAQEETIEHHCEELSRCEGIIIIHPNWWGQPPAILKGWIDRVLRPGVAYRFLEGDSGEGVPEGLLAGKTALVLNTSDTPMDRERTVFGDPLELIWRQCVFAFCGLTHFRRKTFGVIVTSSPEQRKAWLEETAVLIGELFPKRD